jgi:hypothetical protein
MGTFDSHVDAPDQIRIEGENITISFERTGDATGTLSWNIPPPAAGCNSENQAYTGIVIVGNTVANSAQNWPADGTVYSGDPTLDSDLHTGSELGGGLVVGAFYNDKTTTTLDVSGLQANTAYFFTAHAVDNVNRYHKQGVSTYALPYLYREGTSDRSAFQEITFDANVSSSAATGLSSGATYTIDLNVDGTNYDVTVRGSEAQTFGALVDEINYQIQFLENPTQGAQGPNAGSYWYADEKLYQWDGETHNELSVINDDTDPSDVDNGEYWLDTANDLLYLRSAGAWSAITPTESGNDPADPNDGSYWMEIDGSPESPIRAWEWEATTWCEKTLYTQSTDPSCAPTLTDGTFWFDENTSFLKQWNTTLSRWDTVEGIAWDVDPRTPTLGSFWFNDTDNELYERTTNTVWTQRTVIVSSSQPSNTYVNGTYWWDRVNEQLYVKQAGSPLWAPLDAIVWGSDPTLTSSCDLWWDLSSSPQVLKKWDAVNSEWDVVESFTISTTDPSLAATVPTGAIWAQTGGTSIVYWKWDGSQFVQISSANVFETLTDPTVVSDGDVWHDTTNDVYYECTLLTWTAVDPIKSTQDPTTLAAGTFWYNTTAGTLNMWNGAAWVNILFSTTPLYPSTGTLWYNTTTETLLEWNTTTLSWETSTPIATATLNSSRGSCKPNGNIVFETSTLGSDGAILVGSANDQSLSTFASISYLLTGSLWDALDPRVATAQPNVVGVDGLTGEHSYNRLGVGTDGSADERRELADSIRRQLGHPTITVELDKEQLDTAIQKSIESLRQRSASAYRRVYFFMDAKPGVQNYLLTNERAGFHKIVNIMGVWRVTSAFLSTVHAAGVYGQTIIQHLYHMGTYDLVSYHLISDYIEQLEQLFATRVTYTWDENSREFFMFQRITRDERVLLDAVIERTEQELMTNRYTKKWIERWALGEAKLMLAQIRGKYATLPGAGGGVALNAGDLTASAQEDFARCDAEIDDFVVNDVENLGIGSELIIG